MSDTRLDHVGLNVEDIDGMSAWYMTAFGYRQQFRADLTAVGVRFVMLTDDRGGRLELLTRAEGKAGLRAAGPNEAAGTWGYGHMAFVVSDLAATHVRLKQLGARTVMAPRPSPETGLWMAWVHDPEGNLVELIGPPADAGQAP